MREEQPHKESSITLPPRTITKENNNLKNAFFTNWDQTHVIDTEVPKMKASAHIKTNFPKFDSDEDTAESSDSSPILGKRAKLGDLQLESIQKAFAADVDFEALEDEMCLSLLGPHPTGPIKMTKQPKVYFENKRHCKSKE